MELKITINCDGAVSYVRWRESTEDRRLDYLQNGGKNDYYNYTIGIIYPIYEF